MPDLTKPQPRAKLSLGNSMVRLESEDNVRSLVAPDLTFKDPSVGFELKQAFFAMRRAEASGDPKRLAYWKGQYAETKKRETRCFLDEDGMFPAGHLDIVRRALRKHDVWFEEQDLRKVPAPTLAAELKDAVKPRWYQTRVWELTSVRERGVIEAAVGSGKSLIMAGLIAQKKVPTLVVCPSRDLVTQTVDALSSFLSGVSIGTDDSFDVWVSTQAGILAKHKKDTLEGLIVSHGTKMILCDEVHHAAADGFMSALPDLRRVYYRYGLTGTFFRPDGRTLALWGFISEVLFQYPATQAVEEGFLTPLKTIVHHLPGKKNTNYQKEYKANYCGSPAMLSKILAIVRGAKGKQILILVQQKDAAGAVIQKYLSRAGIKARFISGDDTKNTVRDNLLAFNEQRLQVLIGSKIIGEGIDVRSTDHLILATGGKSGVAVTQAVGRAVRLFPGKSVAYLHDFRFKGTQFQERHLTERLEVYRDSFGASVEEVP